MTPARRTVGLILFLAVASIGRALAFELGDELHLDGFVDGRLIEPGSEKSWIKGGFGKLRYGSGGFEANAGGIVLVPWAQITPALIGVVDLRYDPGQRDIFGVDEAYLRYRPVSTTPWRWSVKAGAFFPPISLENDAVGWTSPWTITPSAINSWVGEELRTIGVEPRLEWRGEAGTLTATAATFGAASKAGTLLADGGWNLSDVITPLGGRVRLPSAWGAARSSRVFDEVDNRVGWYAGASWRMPEWGELSLLRYDNDADLDASVTNKPWRTRFWSLGAKTGIDEFTILAQGMLGDTSVAYEPEESTTTRFYAAYLLVGWQRGDWRIAGRVDRFGTGNDGGDSDDIKTEHGLAETLAVTWRPRDWLRLTGEALRVDSTRAQRLTQGLARRSVDDQFQASARLFF
ncbi:hypothetical protein GCM10011611_31290 [Aliidongia dinghuensis]|uniref:Porin n=1 Tax=Aliidongia dinghuensis TaxID=1867774 RepID=A0A8J2YUJ1_9PROT|nr:hypothetical protein [Aliidongia dinghuensis]GGF22933.1 hypothetical protein GCM10011611_31290 [Aliidongia dinghuensis]